MAADTAPSAGETENVAVCRRFVEEFVNTGDPDAAAAVTAEDVVVHQLGAEVDRHGREELVAAMGRVRDAIPDWTLRIVDVVDGGDRVVLHIHATGTPERPMGSLVPTGKSFEIDAIHSFRLEGGTIVEVWMLANAMSLGKQLGLIPPTPRVLGKLLVHRVRSRLRGDR